MVIHRRKQAVLASETLTVLAGDIPTGQTSAGFRPGDVVTWEAALHGLLMASAGDAAEAMARVIGDEIRRESGSGSAGRERFVAEMNALAAELGLVDSTFGSPSGVVQASTSTALDIARLARAAWGIPALEAISGKASYTMRVEGPNARSYAIHHTSKVINGPYMAPDGIGVDGVVAAKTGTSGSGADNEVVMWLSPAGVPVILCVIDSDGDYEGYLDVTGILMQLAADFPELGSAESRRDPDFGAVAPLTGADDGYRDDSPARRTMQTAGGAQFSRLRPLAGTASYLFDGIDGRLWTSDVQGLSLGAEGSDFTIELSFAPAGKPRENCTLLSKYDRARNGREYELTYYSGSDILAFHVSTDGRDEHSVAVRVGNGALWSGGRRSVLVQRRGGVLEMFVNHDRIQGATVPGPLHSGGTPLTIGCAQEDGLPYRPFAGRIDEVRITRGIARAGDTPRFTATGGRFARGG